MAVKMWVVFVTGRPTMKLFFIVTGQTGVKFGEQNVNRCALLNLNRRTLKIVPQRG